MRYSVSFWQTAESMLIIIVSQSDWRAEEMQFLPSDTVPSIDGFFYIPKLSVSTGSLS